MDKISHLKMDTKDVDITLAKMYMQKFNIDDDWSKLGDNWKFTKYPHENEPSGNVLNSYLGLKLANKIEENAELFIQLEYLIRRTEAANVKCQIKLISQHLRCHNVSWATAALSTTKNMLHIVMNVDTPLYVLGCVASAIYMKEFQVEIVTSEKTAPLCQLFVQLLNEFGWKIHLIIVPDIEVFMRMPIVQLKVIGEDKERGCIGVVTEKADIDSAIDIFINSSVKAPWRIQRLYVQESVYDEVKGALAWKCARQQCTSCVDAFAVDNKIFACDALDSGQGDGEQVVIPVEAYRTAKELGALLARHSSYLSVWSADSALSNEIAHAAAATFVWINEYATFDGPPQASLPVYQNLYPEVPFQLHRPIMDKLSKLSVVWAKLNVDKRIDIILKVLENYFSPEKLDKILKYLLNRKNGNFVHVDGGRICFGIEHTAHVGVAQIYLFSGNDEDLFKAVHFLVSGNAIAIKCATPNRKVFESLESAGIPIIEEEGEEPNSQVLLPIFYDKIKVISTNFGTIFAN